MKHTIFHSTEWSKVGKRMELRCTEPGCGHVIARTDEDFASRRVILLCSLVVLAACVGLVVVLAEAGSIVL